MKDKSSKKNSNASKANEVSRIFKPASKLDLPENYTEWFIYLKSSIEKTRLKIVLNSNSEMILLYWNIGLCILDKQKIHGWGSNIIARLSLDLKNSFPEMKGFSPRNLKYMRKFASTWPKLEIVQEVLAQLGWHHNITLLEKLNDKKRET